MRYKFLRFPQGKTKAVTLSYDDGCRHDIKFSEIITKHGLKCTFNINSDFISDGSSDWYLTKEEIAEHIVNKGHEIAVHGARHRANGQQRAIDGIRDVLDCRLSLEKEFGMIIRGMAYPDSGITRFGNGANYESIKRYLTDLDIAYSRTLGGDNDSFTLPTDWHSWMPSAHHNNSHIFEFIEKFLSFDITKAYTANRYPRLLYIWGHSFEFDRNNNWERLEEICEKLSGKEDIWYATNIEIYDYVTAYNSLIFSADNSIIYNPTLKTVWFDIDGKSYKIEPDETLKL